VADARKDTELAGVGCFVVIVILALGTPSLWQQADDAGWIWHDKLTIVTAKNWSTGEYKACSEANVEEMKAEPQIDCSSYAEYGEPKRFKVRFYGKTYKEELKDKASFSWRCKKNEGTDPAFTCDEQKIVRWDEKK